MPRNFIFLIEMKKDSLLAAGLSLELKGFKVMASGKSENPMKKILELENCENPVDPEELLEKVAGAGDRCRWRRPSGK